MLEPSSSRFWHVGLQSGLISEKDLRTCWDALPEEKRTADAIDRRLARQAVTDNKLTLWQAQQLLAGKSSGYKIDKYILLDRIGQGGMGRVYLAKDTRLNRNVALKVLSPERMNNPRAIARFKREAKVGAQLQHENLVRIYDEGNAGGLPFLVMEHINGKNLAKVIGEGGPMPPMLASKLARQVALGLEHANQKGLIHRDVNPSNILVTFDGTAKLTDLGLAIDLADSADVTRDGATVGTFDYVSPEQARNSHGVDTRSDVYSLGCTLYHMLTAQVPFPYSSLPEKLYAHQLQDPVPLTDIVSSIPPSLDLIVRRMMKKLPADRFQTPLAVANALEPFIGDDATPIPRRYPHTKSGRSPEDDTKPLPALPMMLPAGNSATSPSNTPAPDHVGSGSKPDPFVALPPIDLGLDGPLVTGLTSKPRPKPAVAVGNGQNQTRKWLAVGLVAGLSTVLTGAGLWMRARPSLVEIVPAKGSNAGEVSKSKTQESFDSGKGKGTEAGKGTDTGITVYAKGEGPRSVSTFREAVQVALARGGEVVLTNSIPIKISDAKSIEISGRPLTIRAGEGATPVLEVELKGQVPWLLTRSGAPVTLRGLTIHVKYSDTVRLPALIWASDRITVESCSFHTKSAGEEGRAIHVEGRQTTIRGCFFNGFGRAIEFLATANSTLDLEQTTFVNASQFGQLAGWAVLAEVKAAGAVAKGAKPQDPVVRFKRCTINMAGAIDISAKGLTAWRPLRVEMAQTAIRANAMLGWPPPPAKLNFTSSLHWIGEDNRYEIADKEPFVVLSALGGAVAPDPTLSTLEAWNSRVAENNDKNAAMIKLEFATPIEQLTDRPMPRDFGLSDEVAKIAGADPLQVGAGTQK